MSKKRHSTNSNKINIVINTDKKEKRRRRRNNHPKKKINQISLGEPRQLQIAKDDMSNLVNQIVHENKILRELNKNPLLEDVKDDRPKQNVAQEIMQGLMDAGGEIKNNKNSINFHIPKHINTHKTHKVKKIDIEELDNELNNMAHHNHHKDNSQALNAVLEREDANFQDVNDKRDMEPHSFLDLDLNAKAVKITTTKGRPKGSTNKKK